jgi:hypothetical protein
MSDVTLELADRLWRGEVPAGEYHPVGHRGGLAEIATGWHSCRGSPTYLRSRRVDYLNVADASGILAQLVLAGNPALDRYRTGSYDHHIVELLFHIVER